MTILSSTRPFHAPCLDLSWGPGPAHHSLPTRWRQNHIGLRAWVFRSVASTGKTIMFRWWSGLIDGGVVEQCLIMYIWDFVCSNCALLCFYSKIRTVEWLSWTASCKIHCARYSIKLQYSNLLHLLFQHGTHGIRYVR